MEKMRTKEEILRDERKKMYPKSIPLGELEVLIDIRDLLDLLVHPEYEVPSESKVEEIRDD